MLSQAFCLAACLLWPNGADEVILIALLAYFYTTKPIDQNTINIFSHLSRQSITMGLIGSLCGRSNSLVKITV